MDNCFTGQRDRSRQTSEKDVLYISAAPISGPFDALIDYSITFNASIKKNEIRKAEKGLRSSMFPVESNERGSDFP